MGNTWKISVLAFLLWCSQGVAQVFVGDVLNGSVLEYDNSGAFVRTFISPGSGGLTIPDAIVFGPDGNLYISNGGPLTPILRYNGPTGTFMNTFVSSGSGGALDLGGMVFGPNGNLFVADFLARNVKEYDGNTGAFIRVFASSNVTSVTAINSQVVTSQPSDPLFGPDGNFYLGEESDVEEFDGSTGAFIRAFPSGPGLAAIEPTTIAFGPDGNLYVGTSGPCCPEIMGEILKYNPSTGAFIGVFVPPGSGGLQSVGQMEFGPDGNLYVASGNTAGINSTKRILRFNATTGAFVDVFIAPGAGGIGVPGGFAFAPLPSDAYQLSYAANLAMGSSIVNLTNAGSAEGFDPSGDICANVYVFAEDEQLIACCTCPLTPNNLETLSVQKDLISNTLTPGVPVGVTVALLASTGTCNAAAVSPAMLVSGLRAWGTTLHAAPGGGYGVTENPFTAAALSSSVLTRLTSTCAFIQADGSGFGICGSCRQGAAGAASK